MKKEEYRLIELEVIAFAAEDILTESDELPMQPATQTECAANQ